MAIEFELGQAPFLTNLTKMKVVNESVLLPFYAKLALILISVFAIISGAIVAQGILIPIIYSIIFAILLNPIVNLFVRLKINKMVAIGVTVTFAFIVIILVGYLIFSQISFFSKSLPKMQENFVAGKKDLIVWFSRQTSVDIATINQYLSKEKNDQISSFAVGDNFIKFGHIAVTLVILPVYTTLILFYKPLLLDFIRSLFKNNQNLAVGDVLIKTKKIIQTYVVGIFIETIIVAILNSIGLTIIGLESAILLGCIGALLNIVPYVGAIIAASIYMAIALLTLSPIYMLYVLIMYLLIQFIDNNFLLPKIVAARVRINALASILVVIIGGTIWGIPGMFLAIPLTAIIKVICDHIDGLKPWGFLLGDNISTKPKYSLNTIIKRKSK